MGGLKLSSVGNVSRQGSYRQQGKRVRLLSVILRDSATIIVLHAPQALNSEYRLPHVPVIGKAPNIAIIANTLQYYQ